jgi:Kef-type K+ transport system membrane component KefB
METTPVIALYLTLGIVIMASRIAGSTARRLGQPRVLGELLVGILLGPTLLDLLHSSALGLNQAHLSTTLSELAEMGVLLLMFNVGLEVQLDELAKVGRVAGVAGLAGTLLSLMLTLFLTVLAGYDWRPALFAGVALAATSVSISAQVLLEMGLLRTKVGNALLATALVDDVAGLLLLSLAIAITGPQGDVNPGALLLVLVRMAAYIAGAGLVAWFILPHLMAWVHDRPILAASYGVPALALVLILFFGWSAEVLGGVAAITGAFIAGVGLSRCRETIKRQIEVAVVNIAYAFLVPIFFVSVGLQIDLKRLPMYALPFALCLLLCAVIAKVAGCGLGARVGGFTKNEAIRLGVCMIPRGEVGLIVISLALSRGFFRIDDGLLPSLFLVILLTPILTPPLVRHVFLATGGAE